MFADELTKHARAQYGTVGRAFVAWLQQHRADAVRWVDSAQQRMLANVPEGAAPTVRRATRKFAILSAAAEMASHAGLTGWTVDEAINGVETTWQRWLAAFGIEDRDDARLIEQANEVLQKHQLSRFVALPLGDTDPVVHNLMGYKRMTFNGDMVFLVTPGTFKSEVIAGYEARRACEILHKAEMLDRPKGRDAWTVHGGKGIGQVYENRDLEGAARYWKQAAESSDATPIQVAETLFNSGFALEKQNRLEEAIATYDQVIARFGDATELALREQVARAMVNKGAVLSQLQRKEEAIAINDQVITRFGDATEFALREQVARAMVNQGATLAQLQRTEEAIAIYDQVIARFGDATELALREQVSTRFHLMRHFARFWKKSGPRLREPSRPGFHRAARVSHRAQEALPPFCPLLLTHSRNILIYKDANTTA